MTRSIVHASVAFLALLIAGCSATRPLGPQTAQALRAECKDLAPGPGVDVAVQLSAVERRIAAEDPMGQFIASGTDSFRAAAADADAIWWYDDSTDYSGTKTGEGGLIALEGCTVTARETVIVYN